MTSMDASLIISPEMRLKKATFFFNEAHLKELGKMSRRTLIPASALVRKAIAEFLERNRKKKPE
jgi:hypothetical protein